MHRRQRTFAEMLTRSLATAGLLYALVFAYAVPATLRAEGADQPGLAGPDTSSLSGLTDHPAWRPAHANRFPGCIDMAKWASSQVPDAVVVVRRDGGLTRMSFDEAFRRANSGSLADDVWTIGACG